MRSPYLTAKDAALYLQFKREDGTPNMNAFYQFRYKCKLRALRRGGSLLFRITDLDAALEDEAVRVAQRPTRPRPVASATARRLSRATDQSAPVARPA